MLYEPVICADHLDVQGDFLFPDMHENAITPIHESETHPVSNAAPQLSFMVALLQQ